MLSVIIPTYNRKNLLPLVLDAFARQTQLPRTYEIIFIDDGSDDGTREFIQNFRNLTELQVRYFFQNNKGPAAARNLGIKEAKYELLLFINDDTIPAEDLIERHVSCHERWSAENIAVLGQAVWARGISVPVYAKHYLVSEFKKLNVLKEARSIDFITCNISVKKRFVLNNGLFDEDFPYAAHEDRELGHRLGKKGLRIKYVPKALVYHYHLFQSLDVVLKHSKRLGQALAIWETKIPDEKYLLYEFDLPDYSSSLKAAKESVKGLFFNSKALPLWLWVISKLKNDESFTYYLYRHIMGQAHRKGYLYQKKVMKAR